MPDSPHPRRALTALLAAFFALALFYNAASPLFENSDEFFHFPFIRFLADNNGYLPVQSGDDLQDWRQQGSQPPIYHLLSALLIKPIDTGDYAEVRRVNPHAQIGIVGESNINAVIHPLDRGQEFQGGTAWAVRLVRLFSTALASVVVLATYFLTVYTFPDVPRWVGLLAAALVAFNPMYLFVASSINNDNLSNAVIAAILALFAWLYRRDSLPSPRILLLIGFLLGIGLLSKLSLGPFMLLVGLYWLLLARKHNAFPYMVKWGFATLGLALLISAWWYIRNWQLYGDPTGLNTFLDIVGRRPIPLTAEQLWSERESFIFAFWGLFGGLTVDMAGWTYGVFNLLAGVSLIGAVIFFLRRKPDYPAWVLWVWPLMAFISLIRWTALTWATQGRLWYIALSALAALSAVGFYEIGRRLSGRVARRELTYGVAGIPVAYALVIAIAAPIVWIIPAYAAPELTPIGEREFIAVYSDPAAPGEQIGLVSAAFPEGIRTGEAGYLEAELCALTNLSRNWSVFAHLTNPFDIILAQADFTPGGGALPTAEIAGGQCWQDRYPIRVGAGVASEDTPLNLLLGLYDARDNTRMMLAGSEETRFLVGETRLEVGDELLKFSFAESVRLTDYSLSEQVVSPGEALTLTLEWEVLRALEADYTVFVQVLDTRTSDRYATSDKPPDGGTAAWEVGQTVTDIHSMTVSESAPPGVYAVIVGFYIQTPEGAFQRLRLAYDGVDTGFDYLTLTQVRIE